MDYCKSKEHADLYVKYRPYYPDEIYRTVLAYCKQGSSRQALAVDVGCGSGINTIKLSQLFDHVIGIDNNLLQLEKSKEMTKSNITYKMAFAEDLGFIADSSVDLVTAATCFHYFDHKKFFQEIDRILTPKGVLAIYGYPYPQVKGCPEAMDFYKKVQREDLLKKYGTFHLNHYLNLCRDISIPMKDVIRIDDIHDHNPREVTLDDILNYLKSTTTVQKYINDKSLNHHTWKKIEAGFEKILHQNFSDKNGSEAKFELQFSFYLILARKTSIFQ